MTPIDYILLGIVLISCLISVWRGFLKEVFSLGAWILAGFFTFTFSSKVAVILPGFIESPTVRLGVAALLVFILTLITAGTVNYLIQKAVAKVGLSGTDRLLGLLFGLLRAVVIIVVLVLLAGLTPLPQEKWWQEALLLEYFVRASVWIQSYLPEDLARYLSFDAGST
ncbi:MAG: CvpA family protein [Pseudomonadota bacterium]